MIVCSRAPLRISFLGGGTDVPPYVDEYGGVVLNATIDKYIHCSLKERDDDKVVSHTDMMIVEAAEKIKEFFEYEHGIDIYLSSDVHSSSGLGSSSTAIVAFLGAFMKLYGVNYNRYTIARVAWRIERQSMMQPGGKQDQYASVFGGLNYMKFKESGEVDIKDIKLQRDIRNDLQHRLLLCYVGLRATSGYLIEKQQKMQKENIQNLHRLKKLTERARTVLERGDIVSFAGIINDAWDIKKRFSEDITNSFIDDVYETAMEHGALGGKISGAGGGGYMYFICDPLKKHVLQRKLKEMNIRTESIRLEEDGLQMWSI